jgi:hypothetical protein
LKRICRLERAYFFNESLLADELHDYVVPEHVDTHCQRNEASSTAQDVLELGVGVFAEHLLVIAGDYEENRDEWQEESRECLCNDNDLSRGLAHHCQNSSECNQEASQCFAPYVLVFPVEKSSNNHTAHVRCGDTRGKSSEEQSKVADDSCGRTQYWLQRLRENYWIGNFRSGSVQNSSCSDDDCQCHEHAEDYVETSIKLRIRISFFTVVFLLASHGVIYQVDCDDCSSNQTHAVNETAFWKAWYDTLCNAAPVWMRHEHADDEEYTHGNDEELADEFQQLRSTEYNCCSCNQSNDETGNGDWKCSQVCKTVGCTDFVSCHESKTGEQNRKPHEDGYEVLPSFAVAHSQRRLNYAVATEGSDTGRNIHQDDGSNTGEYDRPKHREAEIRSGNGRCSNCSRSDERTGNDCRRSHVLELTDKRFLFHKTPFLVLNCVVIINEKYVLG